MQWVSIAYCCCYLDDINFAWVGCVILHVTRFSPMFMCLVFRFTYTCILESNGDRSISLLSIAEPSARIILLCVLLSHLAIHEIMHV